MKIKDLNRVERPREKLVKYGVSKLRNEELLAIILGSGKKGKNVLELAHEVDRIIRKNEDINFEKLNKISGLGLAKKCALLACFELGKRNLSTKEGANQIGFFFSNRDDLAHYGSFIKSRYLNIKKPWDIRELGIRTEYKNFRQKLKDIGISDKDLAGYDLQFQKLNIKRNKKLGSNHGLYKDGDALLPMHETRMATFNFFDAGEGYYLRKLLQAKGFDGILFEDEGELTAIVFEPKQIVDPFSN